MGQCNPIQCSDSLDIRVLPFRGGVNGTHFKASLLKTDEFSSACEWGMCTHTHVVPVFQCNHIQEPTTQLPLVLAGTKHEERVETNFAVKTLTLASQFGYMHPSRAKTQNSGRDETVTFFNSSGVERFVEGVIGDQVGGPPWSSCFFEDWFDELIRRQAFRANVGAVLCSMLLVLFVLLVLLQLWGVVFWPESLVSSGVVEVLRSFVSLVSALVEPFLSFVGLVTRGFELVVLGTSATWCIVAHGGSWVTMLLFVLLVEPASATCQICQGFFEGCTGGDDSRTCAGAARVVGNGAALVAASSATLTLVGLFKPRVLRVFNSTVLGFIKQYASAPVAGTPFDFSGKLASDVVKAAIAGKVSKSEVQIHFSVEIERIARLTEADGRDAKLAALKTQIALLETVQERGSTSSSSTPLTGVFVYVWAKCSEVVLSKDNKVTVGSEREKEKGSTSASAKVCTPTAPEEFFEILCLWQAMLATTGLAPLTVTFDLLQNVVWQPVRGQGASWMLAHELLLAYLDRVDQSVDRSLTLGNVYKMEGVDAMRAEAKAAAEKRFGAKYPGIFRHTEGARVPGGNGADDVQWNNKSSAKAGQPCMAWNKGVEHKCAHLFADGTCKFRHACNKWIKLHDGKVGYCFRNHTADKCDRDASELSDVGPSRA